MVTAIGAVPSVDANTQSVTTNPCASMMDSP